VGRSTASRTDWSAGLAAPPTGDFTLTYVETDAVVGYVAELGANRVPLSDILSANSDVTVRGWAGLAQPATIRVRLRDPGIAQPTPHDFVCTYRHDHEHWTRIRERDGEPGGDSDGAHEHGVDLDQFISAIWSGADEVDARDQWYPVHLHPLD
jgi:hypothetical protein